MQSIDAQFKCEEGENIYFIISQSPTNNITKIESLMNKQKTES